MGISPDRQFTAFLYAVLAGVICGFMYDCIRISRVLIGISQYTRMGKRLYERKLPLIGTVQPVSALEKHRLVRLILLSVGDLIFAVGAGAAFSVFLYHAASGLFRWFYLLGCGIGYLLYYQTAGRLVMLSSEALVFCLKAILRYMCWLLLAPVRALWWLFGCLCTCIRVHVCRPIARRLRHRRRVRFTRRTRKGLAGAIRITLADLS